MLLLQFTLQLVAVITLSYSTTLPAHLQDLQNIDTHTIKQYHINQHYHLKGKAVQEAIIDSLDFNDEQKEILKNNPLLIGCGASGGGTRAMAALYCFLHELNECKSGKLAHSIDILTGVSGATWAMLLSLAHNTPLDEMEEAMNQIFNSHNSQAAEKSFSLFIRSFIDDLLNHRTTGQAMLHYANFLDKLIFSSEDATIKNFSDYRQEYFATPNYDNPFMIFSAIATSGSHYEWLLYTPYHVGIHNHNHWISEELFSQELETSFSQYSKDKQFTCNSLAYHAALFGSAFAVNVYDMKKYINNSMQSYWNEKKETIFLMNHFNNAITACSNGIYSLTQSMQSSSVIQNLSQSLALTLSPTKKALTSMLHYRPLALRIKNIFKSTTLSHPVIDITDPGISCSNVPLQPLICTDSPCNLIFILDVTDDYNEKTFQGLQDAYNQAERNHCKLPTYDSHSLQKNDVTIFHDEQDPTIPVIIYINLFIKDFKVLMLDQIAYQSILFNMKELIADHESTILSGYRFAYENVLKQQALKQQV